MSRKLLVTGGAGYIGSHMVMVLVDAGYDITVFDNLSRGFREAVVCDDFVQGDLLNPDDLKKLFATRGFDTVVHFAALAYVGESVAQPRKYYENNVIGTLNLLNGMLDAGVGKIVFSSTCATYGIPEQLPITEEALQRPINPYGRTKLIIEDMLADYAVAYGMNSVSLRYFNAAGCDPKGELGERHDPETHLIPLVLREAQRVLAGGAPFETELSVFGDDFATSDGTCVRDYIHVTDLCRAHLAAIELLWANALTGANAFNLGNGKGFSVKEVVASCRRVTGIGVQYKIAPRRLGDPPVLVGSAAKAKAVLGWQPEYTELDDIVATAWRWMQRK
jgi:UDP-glucose-4-epimerase GalE